MALRCKICCLPAYDGHRLVSSSKFACFTRKAAKESPPEMQLPCY